MKCTIAFYCPITKYFINYNFTIFMTKRVSSPSGYKANISALLTLVEDKRMLSITLKGRFLWRQTVYRLNLFISVFLSDAVF